MNNQLQKKIWEPRQGRDLRNQRVGVVGLGSIGKEVVSRLNAFGCEIFSASRSWNNEFANRYNVTRLSIGELFKTCSVISIHLPLETSTVGIITAELISEMPSGSFIINTSRSGVIDNNAVCSALHSGQLSGVAIDVFDEKPDPRPYLNAPNVILSPHIGSFTHHTRKAMEVMSLKTISNIEIFDNSTSSETRGHLSSYLSKVTVC